MPGKESAAFDVDGPDVRVLGSWLLGIESKRRMESTRKERAREGE